MPYSGNSGAARLADESGQRLIQASTSDTIIGEVFVGRQREMAELQSYLGSAVLGRGRLVIFTGEPGIGKTRLARELGAYAILQGIQVAWGRCHEARGTPP